MAAKRALALKTLHALLTNHQPLVALTPIYGNTAGLVSLPVPSVIYTPGSSTSTRGEEFSWDVGLEVVAEDVFKLAAMLDAIDEACANYVYDPKVHPVYVGLVEFLGTSELASENALGVCATRATTRLRWSSSAPWR